MIVTESIATYLQGATGGFFPGTGCRDSRSYRDLRWDLFSCRSTSPVNPRRAQGSRAPPPLLPGAALW